MMAQYGCKVENIHANSIWRRELVFEARNLRLEIRPMTPDDDRREKAFFDSQTLEERTMRFMGGMSMLAAWLRLLTHIDFSKDFAIVAVDRAADTFAGVARYVHQKNDLGIAHAAVAVLKKYQRIGLAHYLLTAVFDAAIDAGLHTLVADILMVNHASKQLFAKVARETGAQQRIVERDGRVDTYNFLLPCRQGVWPRRQGSVVQPPTSGAKFDSDRTRHPMSLWRRDLIFPSGMRIEIRPADADDRLRLERFRAQLLASGELEVSATIETSPDFSRGFMLVAVDYKTDDVVAAGAFKRGSDTAQLQVATASSYRGLGIADALLADLLQAVTAEFAPVLRAAL